MYKRLNPINPIVLSFAFLKILCYSSGSQTVRRETLSGAPRKYAKVVALTAFLTTIAV